MYRPGETVRVKGWLRTIGAGPRGDVEAAAAVEGTVDWTLFDSRSNEVAKGDAPVDELGGFDLALDLPDTINLGPARLRLSTWDWSRHDHVFEVQEFRRPEFEVTAAASDGPFFVGDAATVTVSAAYYAGGALPGADVSWRVTATRRPVPPAEPRRLLLRALRALVAPRVDRGTASEREETLQASTDGSGVHRLRIDLEGGDPPRPPRRARRGHGHGREPPGLDGDGPISSSTPRSVYVGLRSRPGRSCRQGEPIAIDVIATDLDGLAIAGRPVRLRAERLDWEARRRRVEGGPQGRPRRGRSSSAADPVRTGFEPAEGGI